MLRLAVALEPRRQLVTFMQKHRMALELRRLRLHALFQLRCVRGETPALDVPAIALGREDGRGERVVGGERPAELQLDASFGDPGQYGGRKRQLEERIPRRA